MSEAKRSSLPGTGIDPVGWSEKTAPGKSMTTRPGREKMTGCAPPSTEAVSAPGVR